jgi:hypothetical protein
MSELNLGPVSERNRAPAIIISVVVLALIAAAVYYISPRTPAQIQVQKIDLFAPHTQSKAEQGSLHILGTPAFAEDNLYVVVHLSIENNLHQPLFLDPAEATLSMPEGVTAATVVSPADAPRLEQTFPALIPLANNPLGSGSEIAPRATQQGTVTLLFPTLTEAAWKSKKSATLTINFLRLPPQTINLP